MHRTNAMANSVALSAGFGRFDEALLDKWGQGRVELYAALAYVAEVIQRWEDALDVVLAGDGFPGGFAYGVSAEVGEFLRGRILRGAEGMFYPECVDMTVRYFVHKFLRNDLGDCDASRVIARLQGEVLPKPAPVPADPFVYFVGDNKRVRRIRQSELYYGGEMPVADYWHPTDLLWKPSVVSAREIMDRIDSGMYQINTNPEEMYP